MPNNNAVAVAVRNVRNVINHATMPVTPPNNAKGKKLLNPPPSLIKKLMEVQAELTRHFPNHPNVIVAFTGNGGGLFGMTKEAMEEFMKKNAPALPQHNPRHIGIPVANVRGYIV